MWMTHSPQEMEPTNIDSTEVRRPIRARRIMAAGAVGVAAVTTFSIFQHVSTLEHAAAGSTEDAVKSPAAAAAYIANKALASPEIETDRLDNSMIVSRRCTTGQGNYGINEITITFDDDDSVKVEVDETGRVHQKPNTSKVTEIQVERWNSNDASTTEAQVFTFHPATLHNWLGYEGYDDSPFRAEYNLTEGRSVGYDYKLPDGKYQQHTQTLYHLANDRIAEPVLNDAVKAADDILAGNCPAIFPEPPRLRTN